MDTPESFSVIINSHLDRYTFQENTSCNFTNELPANLDLTGYEVGLKSLSYYDDYAVPREERVEETVTSSDFFNETRQDNVVLIHNIQQLSHPVAKRLNQMVPFIAHLNIKFENFHDKLKFEATSSTLFGEPTAIKITYEPSSPERILDLGEQLADIFGFSENEFNEGEYTSDRAFNKMLFDQLDVEHIFPVRIMINEQKVARVAQLPRNPPMITLTNAITRAVLEQGYPILVIADQENFKLIFDTRSRTRYVILSPFLNEYLSLPRTHSFSGHTETQLRSELFDENEEQNDQAYISAESSQILSSHQLIVLSNVAGSSYYGSHSLPILAICTRPGGKRQVNYSPPYVFYHPVRVREAKTISIKLVDDQLNEIDSQLGPTLAELHFRKNGYQKSKV